MTSVEDATAPLHPGEPDALAVTSGWQRLVPRTPVTIALAIVLVLLLATASGVGVLRLLNAAPEPAYLALDEARLLDDVEALTANGPRWAGGPAEAAAAELVREAFTSAGLAAVSIETYPLATYEVQSASLALIERQPPLYVTTQTTTYEHLTDFVLQGYSGSTGQVDLPITQLEDGSEAAYAAGGDLSDSAVIVGSTGTDRTGSFIRADEAGAAAHIVHNLGMSPGNDNAPLSFGAYANDAEGLNIPFSAARPDIDIPSLMVSQAVGTAVRAAANSSVGTAFGPSVVLRLSVDVDIAVRDVPVTVGELPGNLPEGERGIILIGAHMDGVYTGPGAIDNAVGTATVMELARALSIHGGDLEHTIRFVTFGAEEVGLLGATEHYRMHREVYDERLIVYMNLDMNNVVLERGNELRCSITDSGHLELANSAAAAFEGRFDGMEAYDVNLQKTTHNGADAAPYSHVAQRPTTYCHDTGTIGWEYHTPDEGLHLVNPASQALSGGLMGSVALALALDPEAR